MLKPPDVFFTPVPDRVLDEMLRLAKVGEGDVVYDLGCGDGRVIIRALLAGAKLGVGVDVDPVCVAASFRQAISAGVADRAEFRAEDFLTTDLRPASVIALYLLDSLNILLRPRILSQCRPGTRVVSYSFEMGEWECDAHTPMAANGVSLWMVPANLAGRWATGDMMGVGLVKEVVVAQHFQRIEGTIETERGAAPMRDGRVRGDEVVWYFEVEGVAWSFLGRVDGDRLNGVLTSKDGEVTWSAARAI